MLPSLLNGELRGELFDLLRRLLSSLEPDDIDPAGHGKALVILAIPDEAQNSGRLVFIEQRANPLAERIINIVAIFRIGKKSRR